MSQRDQRVRFVQHNARCRTVQVNDHYQLRSDRPAFWLQRLCVFILRELGAYALTTVEDVTAVEFYTDDFMKQLFTQRADLLAHFNRTPKQLIIGAEDFKELMRTPEIRQYVAFDAEYHKDRRVFGLRVTIVPWMRGMVVLP